MLPTFNLPGKNITPERQMAMMRTYLNQLKDDTESELYDIKWDNLSKPLREKIDALDRYQIKNDEMMNYISANMITADYLQANYLTASQISATYITAQAVAANYVTASYLSANFASFDWVQSNYLTADQVYAREINADKITSGTVSASRISSSIMRTGDFTANTIASKFSSGNDATFALINVSAIYPSNIYLSGRHIWISDEGATRDFANVVSFQDKNGNYHRVLGRY